MMLSCQFPKLARYQLRYTPVWEGPHVAPGAARLSPRGGSAQILYPAAPVLSI